MESIKKIYRVFLISVGAVITLNAVFANFVSNINAGVIAAYLFGLSLLFYGVFLDRLPRVVKYLYTAAVLLTVAFLVFLFAYGMSDNVTYGEDAVIVLGSGIRGERVTASLKNRLDRAVEYYGENPDAVIVVTGGRGQGENITEALAMERYLLDRGVPQDRIVKEEKATSTKENFEYSKILLDDRFDGDYSVAFITNDYHVYRAQSYAAMAGFTGAAHQDSSTPWYSVLPGGLRECMAVVKLWIFD